MPYVKPALIPLMKLRYVTPQIKDSANVGAIKTIEIAAVGGKWVKPP